MQGKLTVKNSGDKEFVLTFKMNDKITIGRNKRCHLIVKDGKISSMHCQIDVDSGGCRLVDLGSTNGSYVNGKKITASDLNSGDTIKLGNVEILVEYSSGSKKKTTVAVSNFEITETWSETDLPVEEAKYIQDYKILKNIADFGFGENYQAEHKTRNDIVALRKLPVNSSAEAFQKFKEKATFYKKMDSARVLKIFDIIGDNDVPILVMEYIQGCPLNEWVEKKQKISISRCLKIAAYVASGVEYLHRLGIYNIGLCPQHIIIEELTKRIKIFDIAMIRMLENCGYSIVSMYTKDKKLGVANLKNEEADIYALGAFLFYIFTGDMIAEDTNPIAVLEKKRSLPDEVYTLVDDCLKNPQGKKIKDHYQKITQIFHTIKKK